MKAANPDPIHTLFVSHDGGMAGAQTVLGTLLRGLNRARISPYLVIPDNGSLAELAVEIGIPVTRRHLVHWIPCVANLRKGGRLSQAYHLLASMRARVWSIAQLIDRHEIDLVYTNTVTCVEGAIAARITNRPHIWHIHEPITGNSELSPLMPEWAYVRSIHHLSSRVIFPSEALARDYPMLSDIGTVVHNGLKLPSTQDRNACRAAVAAQLNIDASKSWVAVIGALQPRKDHRTFLAAAAAVIKQYTNVHFLIVGSGAARFRQALHTQIAELGLTQHVTLTGRWEGPISTMLAAVDVLTISSEQESFGLTAIESMAVETPVVSTRCGGPAEIIDDGINGTLVDVCDSDGMARAILDLLASPSARRRFGQAGHDKAHLYFSEDKFVRSIEEILAGVAVQAQSDGFSGQLTKCTCKSE
jgi:glycosyltransferase involved in cell wall biosynthesis